MLTTAIECNNKREPFPIDWLFHYRWEKGTQRSPNTPKLPNGRQVSYMTIAGRTSAYVAAIQPRYGAYNMFENDLAAADDDNTEQQKESTIQKKRKTNSGKNEITAAAAKRTKQAK